MSRWFAPFGLCSRAYSEDRHITGLRTHEVLTMSIAKFADASLRRRITLFSFTLALLAIIVSSLSCPNEIAGALLKQCTALAAETDSGEQPAKQLKKSVPYPKGAPSNPPFGTEAGSIRVNNLANLEALINVFANGTEIVFLLAGAVFLCYGFAVRRFVAHLLGRIAAISRPKQFAFGISLTLIGLAIPVVVNWLFAACSEPRGFS
jgi:hypothetical protein